MIQTHSVKRFDKDVKNNGVTTDSDRIEPEPGLTLRDIRFAVLLEYIVDNPRNKIHRFPDSRERRSTDRAIEWNNLLLRVFSLGS
jgi:hypothetical protein